MKISTIASLLCLILAGCASLNSQSATNLSRSGLDVAGQGRLAIGILRTNIASALDGQVLTAAFTDKPSPSSDQVQNMLSVESSLFTEELAFEQLAAVYESFGKLAGGDPLSQLDAQIETLASTLDGLSPNHATGEAKLLSGAGDLAGTLFRSRVLRHDSIQIRQLLEQFENGLIRQEAICNSILTMLPPIEIETGVTLYTNGIGVPSSILKEHLARVGLDYSETKAADALKSAALQSAVVQIIRNHGAAARLDPGSTLAIFLQTFHDLIQAHLRFESLQNSIP